MPKKSEDFLEGFRAAISALGHEGDYRQVDWSEPYEWLKEQYKQYESEPPEVCPTCGALPCDQTR